MERILIYIFIALVITIPFLYRIVRLGTLSWFVKKNQLEQVDNYDKAEQFRFVQIIIGYFYFILHGSMIWGWNNAILFMGISFFISIIMEIVGTRTGVVFGGKYKFDLSKSPGPAYLGIPLVIPLSWSGLIYMGFNYSTLIMGNGSYSNQSLIFLFIPSLLLMIVDLVLDPIAVDEKRWGWGKPGAYYGIPFLNFIGWFFTTFLILWVFIRLQSQIVIDQDPGYFFKYSPGFLFCILPAIASRPCFERRLNLPGMIGLIFSAGLILAIII